MRIEIGQIAECLDRYRRAGRYVIPSRGSLEKIPYRLPAAAGKFGKKATVSEEMKPYPFGDGKNHLAVGDGSEDLPGGELAELDLSFFLTRRAEASAFT